MITLTDTSTDPEPSLSGRLVYLQKADGTYLTPANSAVDYIFWPAASSTIDIAVLDKDYALDILVTWYGGSTALGAKEILCLFRAYSELFLRQLTQAQTARPNLIDNANFYGSKTKLRTLVDDAIQGVEVINDQLIAQLALDKAKELMDNRQAFS